jgi:Predicted O-methyltransferase
MTNIEKVLQSKVVSFVIRKINKILHLSFESIYNLDRVRGCDEIGISSSTSNEHAPTTDYVELLFILLRNCKVRGGTIIDIGCGSGAALVLFRVLPFKRILGVELSKELATKGINNFHKTSRVEVHHDDATTFKYNNIETVFMFNPFPAEVLLKVLSSVINSNERFKLIYRNPKYFHEIEKKYGNLFGAEPVFYKTSNSTYYILEFLAEPGKALKKCILIFLCASEWVFTFFEPVYMIGIF